MVNNSHFVIFPFMSQGHTIPLLYLARLLRGRSSAVTIFTTGGNSRQIRSSLDDIDVSIVELPFPENIDGVENVQNLPSMSGFFRFIKSTKHMQGSFEQALESLEPPVSCIISDVFLGWSLETAKRFGVPRLAFFGLSQFACTMYQIYGSQVDLINSSPDEPLCIACFPHLMLTRNDFESPFNDGDEDDSRVMGEQINAMLMSQGLIVNSFYELEKCYVDYWNNEKSVVPKAFCVGPLCMAAPPPRPEENPSYLRFLDQKLAAGEPVLYVSFGSQDQVSEEQFQEISKGLQDSEVSFIWALKPKAAGFDFLQDFEERVKDRGLVVKEWVDQLQILRHSGVRGFLSHCGWNSVIESISAGVPILALPFVVDQHLNARFVSEEVGVGLRIMPRNGTVRGPVAAEEVERKVRELMLMADLEVRRKVAELQGVAFHTMKEGGSSTQTLDSLIHEMAAAKQNSS